MNSTQEQIRDLGRRWAAAELSGDPGALGPLLAEDFKLVGPLGFVLDKRQMLDRYREGALVVRSLDWQELEVRNYGDAAIAIGSLTQSASYQGRPADGTFRVTQIAVRSNDAWVLAGLHYSPIAAPPARQG